jgi:hypothetical protein
LAPSLRLAAPVARAITGEHEWFKHITVKDGYDVAANGVWAIHHDQKPHHQTTRLRAEAFGPVLSATRSVTL